MTVDDLLQALGRRKTNQSGRQRSFMTEDGASAAGEEEAEIERLMSRLSGKARQANSEDEKTRHVGLVFRNLTVKGMGLVAALQPTLDDPFLGIPRQLAALFSGGPKKVANIILGKSCTNLRMIYTMLQYRSKNTLEFALRTRTLGKASRNEDESRADCVKEFLRVGPKLFWIEHTMETKVGDEFIRARNVGAILTVDLMLAPSESLYVLFDKVVLMDKGKCLYYGPTEEAAACFENLGFLRPQRWTTANFLTSVTDPHECQIREGYEHRIPRSTEQFEAAYKKSSTFESNLRDIESFEQHAEQQRQQRLTAAMKATKEKSYTLPTHKQAWACTHSQFLVMVGDKQSLRGKWGGILFQALIVGSLFFNMPKTSSGVFEPGAVMFFMLLFNALLALAELTSAFSSRPIFLEHQSFSFYRPSAYAIAQTVVDVAIQALIYGFEALMSNEFYNLQIQCVPPYLFPEGPGATTQYQSCLRSGSQPGSTTVSGADYIQTAFTYKRDHLWRDFGIIAGFWIFFVVLTMIGMELQNPNAGGGAVTIFKRGQAPRSVAQAVEKGNIPEDEEKQLATAGNEKYQEDSFR
ncbi:MAG: hypothetical protein Q9161_008626 [Pseudevernia consocians]